MKQKEIETLESYFKTENEHWNEHVFEMVCEIFERDGFENAEKPLEFFSQAINLFTQNNQNPLKAFQLLEAELDQANFSAEQKIFLYERLTKYLRYSEFDEMDLTPISELLGSQVKKLKLENEPPPGILTQDLRTSLKELVEKELQSLPDALDQLEPNQRLNVICRLLPFVLPKVDSIHHAHDEPKEYPSW